MSSPIQVETEIAPDGAVRPLSFVWEGRRYQVLETGRQQLVEGEQRILVMVQGDQAFELSFLLDDQSWHVRRSPEDFGPVEQRI